LSKDSYQKALKNIYIDDGYFVACDGIRGAVANFSNQIKDLPLHEKLCDCIMNINNSADISLKLEDVKVYGNTDNFAFVCIIDPNYPKDDIFKIINDFKSKDNKYATYIKIDPEEIVDKLSRVMIFADSETNSVKIHVEPDSGMTISVDNTASGEEKIEMFKNVNNNAFDIIVDGKSLLECFSKIIDKANWVTNGTDNTQFLFDNNVFQFFMGLS